SGARVVSPLRPGAAGGPAGAAAPVLEPAGRSAGRAPPRAGERGRAPDRRKRQDDLSRPPPPARTPGGGTVMARLSSIRRLAPEARELIATLRNNGQTIEQIRERLGQIGVSVSRSALGRYVRRLDAARPESIGEQL